MNPIENHQVAIFLKPGLKPTLYRRLMIGNEAINSMLEGSLGPLQKNEMRFSDGLPKGINVGFAIIYPDLSPGKIC